MSQKTRFTVKLVAATVIVPFLLGWILSSRILPADYFRSAGPLVNTSLTSLNEVAEKVATEKKPVVTDEAIDDSCNQIVNEIIADKDGDGDSPFDGVSLYVHRNGEPEPCGPAAQDINLVTAIKSAANSFDYCPDEYDKYDFEAFLTVMFASEVLTSDACESVDDSTGPAGLYGFCDMGEERTPILLDHEMLVPVASNRDEEVSLPCHFHTREGVRVTSMEQLMELSRKAQAGGTCDEGDEECPTANAELHLYAVPAGRVFMFAPSYVGEIFELPHVSVSSGLPVYMEVMSVSPRVFDIFNFFDKSESDDLIRRALAEKSETHRLQRSTTGASSNSIFEKRTSESGFDTDGETSKKVKSRCMSVLGYDEYSEGHTDGLQILRYNLTKAYIPHMDYLDSDRYEDQGYDYDSTAKGGNRYATILLYMSDLGEHDGGETVFARGWPVGQPEEEHVKLSKALKELRESGDAEAVAEGSWEEEMVAQCRSRLAVRPNSARAVLFYSQHPDGRPDKASLHGGCPVLKGEKWAANLWVWNAPREGFEGAPFKGGENVAVGASPDNGPTELSAVFSNTSKDPAVAKAELYYEDTFWGPMGPSDPPLEVNTFEGHRWNVKVDGKVVKSWTIGDEPRQVFTL